MFKGLLGFLIIIPFGIAAAGQQRAFTSTEGRSGIRLDELPDIQLRRAIERTRLENYCSLEGIAADRDNCRTQESGEFFRDDATALVRTRTLDLKPTGASAVMVQFCTPSEMNMPDLCNFYVFRERNGRYEAVLSHVGSLEKWSRSDSTKNGFYDLVWGDNAKFLFSWNGSEYVMGKELPPHFEGITVTVRSMEPLDRIVVPPPDANGKQECRVAIAGSRIRGSTSDGMQVTMSCTTGTMYCSFMWEPQPTDGSKSADGKPLNCADNFHVGQTVQFERDQNDDYVVFDATGFDGSHRPTVDRQHLKSWSVDAESNHR